FRTVAVAARPSDVDGLFKSDSAQVAIQFEPDFGRRLASGQPARILVTTDAIEPNSGTSRLFYVNAVPRSYHAELPRGAGVVQIVPQARSRFNPTRESTNLFVPGLMAMVLMIIASLMTALSITREKETGTMEALLVSPLRPWQIIIGKVAPYLGVGF